MAKRIICFFICIFFVLNLAGCIKSDENEELYQPLTTQNVEDVYTTHTAQEINTQAVQVAPATQPQTSTTSVYTTFETIPETIAETAKPIIPDTVPEPSEPPTTEESTTVPQTTKKLEKTGEMEFSDNPDNRYISAVASKYGVNAENLVALYTVPENDSNIVLQFDGTKDADGTLIRNKNTLIAIYSIDRELNSKRASEDGSLNEYSYGEMKVMFFSTTTYIMSEFEELK